MARFFRRVASFGGQVSDGPMRIAVVGCGFVADFYMATLQSYPEFVLAGAYDRDRRRLEAFSRYHRVEAFDSLSALLADPDVVMILNHQSP
jgi:predicted dehydrogenase